MAGHGGISDEIIASMANTDKEPGRQFAYHTRCHRLFLRLPGWQRAKVSYAAQNTRPEPYHGTH